MYTGFHGLSLVLEIQGCSAAPCSGRTWTPDLLGADPTATNIWTAGWALYLKTSHVSCSVLGFPPGLTGPRRSGRIVSAGKLSYGPVGPRAQHRQFNHEMPSQSYRTIKCSSQRNEGWIYGTKEVRETQTGSGILSGHHPKVTVELKKKNLLMEKTRKERKDRNIVRTDVLSSSVNINL